MKRLLLVAALILVPTLPRLALAKSSTISDNNSSLKFTRDDATSNKWWRHAGASAGQRH